MPFVFVEIICEDERVDGGMIVRPFESTFFKIAREDSSVVPHIVSDERVSFESSSNVFCDGREGFFVFDVILSDARNSDDIFRDLTFGIDHPIERFDDFSVFKMDDTDFEKTTSRRIFSRCFGIEDSER